MRVSNRIPVFDGIAKEDAVAASELGRRAGRANGIWLRLLFAPLSLSLCAAASGQGSVGETSGDTDSPDGELARATVVATDPEIVVTARYGEALMASEMELGEQEITNYGAGTIGELVHRVAPLTGRIDEQPIVLINGERVDSTGGIYGFPPEALERLAILPPEAAGRYGYSENRRVVNLVLKKHFVSWQAQASLSLPTAGGQQARRLSLGRFVIDGKSRWNAQGQVSHDTALLKSERSDGRMRDPATPVDAGDYWTLLPASRAMSFTAGVTRPLGAFSGSLNLNASLSERLQLLGPAGVLPPLADLALRGEQRSESVALSLGVSGPVAGWRTNLTARYSQSWSAGTLERAGDPVLADRLRSHAESLAAQLSATRPVLSLPAGQVTANVSIGANTSRSINRRRDAGANDPRSIEIHRRQADARVSFSFPVTSSRGDGFTALGDLSIDLGGSVSAASGAPLRSRYEAGVSWKPLAAIELRAAASFAQLVPTVDQLGGPIVEEVRQTYDYARQEIADPVWISGGNPDLGRGNLRGLSLRASLRPFPGRPWTLSSEYQRQTATGGAGSFPALTPAVERAFPDRVVRDPSGRLILVDARPIRIVRDLNERISNSLVMAFLPTNKAATEGAELRAAGTWQMNVALNHDWLLRSELATHPGLPSLDRLRGDSAQSRHTLGFQVVAGRSGLNATLDGIWQGGYRFRGVNTPNGQRDYRFHALTRMNLRLAIEPQHLWPELKKMPWLSDLSLSFDVQNLLDSFRRATLDDGSALAGYERYEVDPLGRTIQLTVRKRF